MTANHPRFALPLLAFGLLLAAVYAAFARVAASGALDRDAGLLAGAIVFDLTVSVPALFYLLVVRATSLPGISVVPVALGGLFGASVVLPAEHQQAVSLARHLAIPAEMLLLGYVGARVRRAIQRGASSAAGERPDLLERFRSAAAEVVPVPRAAAVVAHEMATLYYALLSWRARPDAGEADLAFSYHRRNGYAGLLLAAGMAGLVEMVAVHALVVRWSEPLAWALTGLSLYGMVWLVGCFQAVRLRPVLLTPDSLFVRIGLLWSVRIPYARIAGLERGSGGGSDERPRSYLHAVTLGPARLRVELSGPVTVEGLYGFARRGVTRIGLAVDDHERFAAELRARVETAAR